MRIRTLMRDNLSALPFCRLARGSGLSHRLLTNKANYIILPLTCRVEWEETDGKSAPLSRPALLPIFFYGVMSSVSVCAALPHGDKGKAVRPKSFGPPYYYESRHFLLP